MAGPDLTTFRSDLTEFRPKESKMVFADDQQNHAILEFLAGAAAQR